MRERAASGRAKQPAPQTERGPLRANGAASSSRDRRARERAGAAPRALKKERAVLLAASLPKKRKRGKIEITKVQKEKSAYSKLRYFCLPLFG